MSNQTPNVPDYVRGPAPALVRDFTNEQYHSLTSVMSKTMLDLYADCPARLKAKMDGMEQEETDSMRVGTLTHIALLEPHLWDASVAVVPADAPQDLRRFRNAKKPSEDTLRSIDFWDAFEASNAGKTIASFEEATKARLMADSVVAKMDRIAKKHGGVNPFRNGEAIVEASFFWTDKKTGVRCRCRPDMMFYSEDGPFYIIDLKTTQSCRPEAFDKSTENFRYDVSAAFYSDGVAAHFGRDPDAYLLITPEKKAPHFTMVRPATPEILRRGREAYDADLRGIAECMRTGVWPDYGDDFIDMALPRWAKESRIA